MLNLVLPADIVKYNKHVFIFLKRNCFILTPVPSDAILTFCFLSLHVPPLTFLNIHIQVGAYESVSKLHHAIYHDARAPFNSLITYSHNVMMDTINALKEIHIVLFYDYESRWMPFHKDLGIMSHFSNMLL